MSKVIGGLIVVAGIWVGVEFMTQGPSRAFDGAFAGFFSESSGPAASAASADRRSTAQRAGDKARSARDEADARRERMLAE